MYIFENLDCIRWKIVCIYWNRVDNVDQASQAKAEIEQKQRNEAEARKERNEVWIPRVNKIIKYICSK